MSIFQDAGLLITGTRLKRLSERFLNEVSRVYKSQDIRFEPAWFPVFFLLDKKGALSLTEIAAELDVSHSAISQMITQILSKKIVEIQSDASDARVKKIVFSSKGKRLLEQVHPVWVALQKSLSQVLPANVSHTDFLNLMSHLEEKLSNNFLSETTINIIQELSPVVELTIPDVILKKKLKYWLQYENINYSIHSDLLLVALHRGNIIGFTAYEIQPDSLFLKLVFVNPFQRRKGIALQMLQFLHAHHSSPCFLLEDANLDLIRVLIKSAYSFKVK